MALSMGRVAKWGGGFLLLAVALGAAAFYWVHRHVTAPREPGEPVHVSIAAGQTGRSIGVTLADEDLIEHPLLFRLALYWDDEKRPIRHGVYALPSGASPAQLLHILYEGPNVRLSPSDLEPDQVVTVPEGLTIAQMATLFDDPEAFIEAAHAPELIERLGISASSLEGFLMPDTYYLTEDATPRDVVVRMVGHFKTEYAKLLEEYPGAADRELLEVVTIASIVEDEAVIAEERPVIASVIYNRLEEGMRLEMDVTLQYALNKYGQRMLHEDKEVDSPYNTYKYAGLPPGPICNPRVDSIRAALEPADTDYLYFVSNADGKTHTFSETIKEHTAAVRKYRREAAKQRRALRQQESSN